MLYPAFFSRGFEPIQSPLVHLQAERCSWSALGGCDRAILRAPLPTERTVNLDQFAGLVRMPVELWDEAGRPAWWGLVWAVHVQAGRAGVSISLDDLANRTRVVYGLLEPEALGGGQRQTTTWAGLAASQSIFGIKEAAYALDLATTEQAEKLRDVKLEEHGVLTPRGWVADREACQVTIELRGWWHTLGWRYFSSAAGLIENRVQEPAYLWDVGTNTCQALAQRIFVSQGGWQANRIWISARRVGYPSSNLQACLCADQAGFPGSNLATGSLTGNNLPDSNPAWVGITLASAPALADNTCYWIKVTDDGSKADGNYYRLRMDTTQAYPVGGVMTYNGATWSTLSGLDLQFRLAGTMETTRQIAAMAGVNGGGQFLAGVQVFQGSGVYTNPYRGGDLTALEEITAHLAAGTTDGEGLTATVNRRRGLEIHARALPATARLMVGEDGVLRLPGGQKARPGPDLAGAWAVMDTRWSIVSADWLKSPGRLYIERAEWRDGSCRVVAATPASAAESGWPP